MLLCRSVPVLRQNELIKNSLSDNDQPYNAIEGEYNRQQDVFSETDMSDELLEYDSSSSQEPLPHRKVINLTQHKTLTLRHLSNEKVKSIEQREMKPQSKLKRTINTSNRGKMKEPPSLRSLPSLANSRKKQITLDDLVHHRIT